MTTVRMTIPDDFILGAAASAPADRRLEREKTGAGLPGPISGTKTIATSGITAMARRWPPILSTAFRKMCS